MRIVVALGGNALLKRGEALTSSNQLLNVRRAAEAIAPLCAAGHDLIITHGNGPQVGLLALQSLAGPGGTQQPLDVLGAQSEGMLGYLIELELRNSLPSGHDVVSILTQVVVDPNDPAFAVPAKPIGPVYAKCEARRLASEKGWSIMRDGSHWRRAVASPKPLAIVELGVIALLASRGVVVICAGGGGIPVARGKDGRLIGIEAVVDKDHASGLLARAVGADCLMLLTDIDGVYLGWRTPDAQCAAGARPADLDPMQFEPGSIRPKIEAAIEFVGQSEKRAMIGRLDDASALLAGTRGTTIATAQPGLQVRDRT